MSHGWIQRKVIVLDSPKFEIIFENNRFYWKKMYGKVIHIWIFQIYYLV